MLPASHRLRRSADFTLTTRSGSRAGRSALVVHLRSGMGADPAKVGFTVSKSVGGSVVRHQVVRRLREAARPLMSGLPAGSFMVVRALPPAAEASVGELRAQMSSALGSIRAKS